MLTNSFYRFKRIVGWQGFKNAQRFPFPTREIVIIIPNSMRNLIDKIISYNSISLRRIFLIRLIEYLQVSSWEYFHSYTGQLHYLPSRIAIRF